MSDNERLRHLETLERSPCVVGTLDGLTYATANFGGDDGTIYLSPASYSVDANYTVPANIHLVVPKGSMFAVADGATLAVNGTVEAGLWQIFSLTGTGAVTLAAGFAEAVYPQWFGAYADGTHAAETTAAIQAALDSIWRAGGILFLAEGTYLVDAAIEVPVRAASPLQIVGAGWRNVYLEMTADDNVIEIISPISNVFISISDLTVNGATRVFTGHGIYLENCDRISLNRIHFINIKGAAIYGIDFRDSFISNCHVEACGDDVEDVAAIVMEGPELLPNNNIRFVDMLIEGCYHGGIEFDGPARHNKIRGCKFHPNTRDEQCFAIYFNDPTILDSYRNIITGCSFQRAGGTATGGLTIELNGARETVIADCTFSSQNQGNIKLTSQAELLVANCEFVRGGTTTPVIDIDGGQVNIVNCALEGGSYGIDISGSKVQISNCRIFNAQNDGIRVVGGGPRQVTVQGSHIFDNALGGTGSGIYVNGGIYCVLMGNTCYDTQTPKTQEYGIRTAGSADYNVVVGNILRGNRTGASLLAGANNEVAHNIS